MGNAVVQGFRSTIFWSYLRLQSATTIMRQQSNPLLVLRQLPEAAGNIRTDLCTSVVSGTYVLL